MSDDTPFSVQFDAEAGLLTATLRGHWSLATLAAYSARLLVEASKLGWRREPFDVLCDAREMPIQSQLVASGLGKLVDIGAATSMNAMAVVVSTVLGKLQAERTMEAANGRVFMTIEDAHAWIAQVRAERTP